MKKLSFVVLLATLAILTGCAGGLKPTDRGQPQGIKKQTIAERSSKTGAQQPILDIGIPTTLGGYRSQVNAELAKIKVNFDEVYLTKADKACFASEVAFNNCFDLVWPTGGGGSFDEAGNYEPTGIWDFTGATIIGLSGGTMTYPAAGVPTSLGSGWGTSYTVGTAANNLVKLDTLARLPAVSAALLTNFPTLNQDTTGSAAKFTTPRTIAGTAFDGTANIDISYPNLTNKPVLGTSSPLNYGTSIGNTIRLIDDGAGAAALPFTLDISDLTDDGGLLGASGGYSNLTSFIAQTPWRLFYSNGSGDVTELSLGGAGTVLKSNGPSSAPTFQTDSTSAGAGYVSPPPTYSDEACTPGQYAASTTTGYFCVASGDWNTFALTNWSNPSPAGDSTPNAFTFTDETNIALSAAKISNAITVAGIDTTSPISVTGDTGYGFSKNSAACTATAGTVVAGDTVAACVTASTLNSTATAATVSIGGVSDTYTVTTLASGGGGDGAVGQIGHATTEIVGGSTTLYLSKFTATSGTVQHPHIYVASYLGGGDEQIQISLFSSTGTYITSVTTTAWEELGATINAAWLNLTLPAGITLGTADYIIGIQSTDNSWEVGTSTTGGSGVGTITGRTFGATTNITPPTFTGTNAYGVIINNTAGAPE